MPDVPAFIEEIPYPIAKGGDAEVAAANEARRKDTNAWIRERYAGDAAPAVVSWAPAQPAPQPITGAE